jgi:hypothetical protein
LAGFILLVLDSGCATVGGGGGTDGGGTTGGGTDGGGTDGGGTAGGWPSDGESTGVPSLCRFKANESLAKLFLLFSVIGVEKLLCS